MVVVKKAKGDDTGSVIRKFNQLTRDLKDELADRNRFIPKPKRRILKSKRKKERLAEERRRKLRK